MSLTSKYVGIVNQGSTCYLNSVIQTLYHLPCFRAKIFALQPKESNPVVTALRNLFAELAAGHRYITTTELTNAFGWDAREASIQHDVHELIQQLFDTLETIMKGTPDEPFIRNLFGGLLVYRSKAADGVPYVSDRLESFYDLELVVEKKVSIEESLQALTAPETIEGVSLQVTPGSPPTKHNIQRTLSLLQLPPVLLLHPNRVGFDMETFEPITLNNRWSFTSELDLTPYMADGNDLRLDKESTEKEAKAAAVSSSEEAPKMPVGPTYELRTVLVHAGDANVGHYYIYVRFPNDEWMCFNDDLVEAATAENVCQASFGGPPTRAYGGRYRPFESERASLLVYVNTKCKEAVLAEAPASAEVLALAKSIEDARKERWNTVSVPFIVADESCVDILDGVPGAVERLAKSVKLGMASSSDGELQATIARSLGVPAGSSVYLGMSSVRLDYSRRYTMVEIVPNSVRVERERAAAAALHSDGEYDDPALPSAVFGFLRVAQRNGELGRVTLFHSETELHQLLRPDDLLFSYSAVTQRLTHVTSRQQVVWGGNFIGVGKDVDPESVAERLRARQLKKTDVYFVDSLNRASTRREFSLTVPESTTYTTLQGGVYDVCKQHADHFPSLPPSYKYVGFYRFDDHTGGPRQTLAPMSVQNSANQSQVEVTHAMLCGRSKDRKLFATFLPIPMSSIYTDLWVVFRLGWAKMPMVYLTTKDLDITFSQLLSTAFEQVGDNVPEALRGRYHSPNTRQAGNTCCVARLLQVEEGIVFKCTRDLTDKVDYGRYGCTVVIDPLPPQLAGYPLVDVFFCSRRRGEDYFGYPTCIVVSPTMTETGEAILVRVGKKLNVPNAAEATKRWMLYVKSARGKTIKLCEPKSVLSDIVKTLGSSDAFEFLIDRPTIPELDGLGTREARSEENGGIVIKSSSNADLSSL